jgi:hypothetical protein
MALGRLLIPQLVNEKRQHFTQSEVLLPGKCFERMECIYEKTERRYAVINLIVPTAHLYDRQVYCLLLPLSPNLGTATVRKFQWTILTPCLYLHKPATSLHCTLQPDDARSMVFRNASNTAHFQTVQALKSRFSTIKVSP